MAHYSDSALLTTFPGISACFSSFSLQMNSEHISQVKYGTLSYMAALDGRCVMSSFPEVMGSGQGEK